MTQINVDKTTRLYMEPIASDGACSEKQVDKRDPAKHAAEWGEKSYAVSFRYYEQDVVELDGEEVKGEKRYDKGEYYLGTMRPAEEYAKSIPEKWMRDNFVSNMNSQGFEYVAVAPNGSVHGLQKDDYVVSLAGTVTKVSDAPADETLKV